jgi:hypothetical protein
VLRTGLETAAWITVDDTSARHANEDEFTTQFGDDRFTAFLTAATKSRARFLNDRQCGRQDFVIDEETLGHMRRLNMAERLVAQLAAHPQKRFTGEAAFRAHLNRLGLGRLKIAPDPIKVATEAALWAAVKDQGLLGGTVIVSDGAGQFRVADHAMCWIHAERLVHKLEPTNVAHRKAVELTRMLIWWFYRDLKAYKCVPEPKRARMMRARFDRIFTKKTGFVLLDKQLRRLYRHKAELLRVLDHPEIPLHTNGWENDIRSVVTKRKISGGTVSEAGKTARDTVLRLMQTCAKLKVSFYQLLGDRFGVDAAPPCKTCPISSGSLQPDRPGICPAYLSDWLAQSAYLEVGKPPNPEIGGVCFWTWQEGRYCPHSCRIKIERDFDDGLGLGCKRALIELTSRLNWSGKRDVLTWVGKKDRCREDHDKGSGHHPAGCPRTGRPYARNRRHV